MKVINATDEVYPVPHNISFLLLCYVYHQWHKKGERGEKNGIRCIPRAVNFLPVWVVLINPILRPILGKD